MMVVYTMHMVWCTYSAVLCPGLEGQWAKNRTNFLLWARRSHGQKSRQKRSYLAIIEQIFYFAIHRPHGQKSGQKRSD